MAHTDMFGRRRRRRSTETVVNILHIPKFWKNEKKNPENFIGVVTHPFPVFFLCSYARGLRKVSAVQIREGEAVKKTGGAS